MSDAPVATRRVLIVANPKARGYSSRKVAAVRDALLRENVEVESRLSQARGDIERMVGARGAAFDVIAVHGGDGTINEALAGLLTLGEEWPALALIPGGTANVLAIETGAARKSAAIAAAILAGRTAPLHYGLANGRPFVLMASAGFDAAVVTRVSPRLKARLGKLAYLVAAFALKRRPATPDLVVTSDAGEYRCRLAICANASRYGGDHLIAPETGATRPGLALVLLTDDRLATLLRIGFRMMARKGVVGAGVRIIEISRARLDAPKSIAAPAQIDGDPFGSTPLDVACARTPARLIVAR